jgi:uncharacterized membrane protein YgcG
LQLSLRAFAALILIVTFQARAAVQSAQNSSVRALGMGDAYTALADDSSSLFYNPAGLARVRGLNWKIFSLHAGASGLEAYNKIKDLNGSGGGDELSDTIQKLYGEHVSSAVGGESIFTMPMLGVGVYNHTDALIKVDNPVYPTLQTEVINDYGYTLGAGVPLGPFLHAGMNLRYVKRTGARLPLGASVLADLDMDKLKGQITGWGVGYAADTGMNLILPAPFFTATLSAVWKNMGKTNYKSENKAQILPSDDNNITLGAALKFDTPVLSIAPAVDFQNLNRTDIQLARKLNFGIEIGLPMVDIRGGFREGYYTAGAGVNLGLFRVDVATYGVELGAYPGQIEDRRYVAEFTMELGIGNFSADGSGSGSKGSASSSGGGSSRSIWGSGRLKQRR